MKLDIKASFNRAGITTVGRAMQQFAARTECQRKAVERAPLLSQNFLARDMREHLVEEIPKHIDDPVPYTRRSPRFRKATESEPRARVYINDEATRGVAPSKYLIRQAEGGRRGPKSSGSELRKAGVIVPHAVIAPSREIRKNKYGNVPGAQYKKMVSDLVQGRSIKSRSKNRYFAIWGPNGYAQSIWVTNGRKATKAFNVIARPGYQARFDFKGIVEDFAKRKAPKQFDKTINFLFNKCKK